jgi:hypothetical protein
VAVDEAFRRHIAMARIDLACRWIIFGRKGDGIRGVWRELHKKELYNTRKTKLRGLSPQANYTDRATAAVGEVVPTFAGRGCYVVSATDSHGR